MKWIVDIRDARAVDLTNGRHVACVVTTKGEVGCWGSNQLGSLGRETRNASDGPDALEEHCFKLVNLGADSKVKSVSAGESHVCALFENGRVKCWGSNDHGQLGLGDTDIRGNRPGQMGEALPFVDLGHGTTVRALSAGGYHTCAVLDDGSVKCWGGNMSGELGIGNTEHRGDDAGEMGDSLPAVDLGADRKAVAVSAGQQHSCAVLGDGAVKCWGSNLSGQLGTGERGNRGDKPGEMGDRLPVLRLGEDRRVLQISAGAYFTCAVLDNARIKCWGSGRVGQLGLGDKQYRGQRAHQMGDRLPALDLGQAYVVERVSAGNSHACALSVNGSVKCWGTGANGVLGYSDESDRGDEPGEMGDALPMISWCQ